MAAAAAAADAPPEPVLLPEDSLTTCRAPRNHSVRKLCETTRSKNMTSSVLLSHEKKLKNWRLTLGNQIFCCCLHENERLYDLREELLRVATDLHGSLGTYVLCIHTQTNTNVTAHRRIRTIAIDRHENSICSMRHTLYTAPCAAVQLQGFQEQPVLLVRP
ncbi:Os02g0685350, partial [Oryza sativa Japonica Group]